MISGPGPHVQRVLAVQVATGALMLVFGVRDTGDAWADALRANPGGPAMKDRQSTGRTPVMGR
jgi:hypothetical protein